jgi:hypothetical protein
MNATPKEGDRQRGRLQRGREATGAGVSHAMSLLSSNRGEEHSRSDQVMSNIDIENGTISVGA